MEYSAADQSVTFLMFANLWHNLQLARIYNRGLTVARMDALQPITREEIAGAGLQHRRLIKRLTFMSQGPAYDKLMAEADDNFHNVLQRAHTTGPEMLAYYKEQFDSGDLFGSTTPWWDAGTKTTAPEFDLETTQLMYERGRLDVKLMGWSKRADGAIVDASCAVRVDKEDVHVKVCGTCLKRADEVAGGKLNICARCTNRWYCSRECQQEDWKLHKPICNEWVQVEKGKTASSSASSTSSAGGTGRGSSSSSSPGSGADAEAPLPRVYGQIEI